jgi:hypothetical protein
VKIKLTLLVVLTLVISACQPPETQVSASQSPTGITEGVTQAVQSYQLEGLLNRPAQLSATKLEGGGQFLSLGAGFHSVVMAQKHPDGSHSMICTDSLEQANQFISGTARGRLEYE